MFRTCVAFNQDMLARFVATRHPFLVACARAAVALALLVLLAWAAMQIVLRNPAVAEQIFAWTGVSQHERDALQLHAEVASLHLQGVPLSDRRWTAEERAHLADVRRLLLVLQWAAFGAAVLVIPVLFRSSRWWHLRRGSAVCFGVVLGLTLCGLAWTVFERTWHPILFPQGNWQFHPARHVMIRLYSPEVLAAMGGVLVLTVCVLASALWAVARYASADPSPGYLGVARRELRWLLMLPLVPLAYWAGLWTYHNHDLGYQMFRLSCVLLVVGALGSTLATRKATWLSVLVLGLSCYWAQVAGIQTRRAQHAQAQLAAQPVIEALAAAAAAQRLPQSFAELPALGVVLPAAPPGAAWSYERWQNDTWALRLSGPLDFSAQYSSWRGAWHTLEWEGLW